MLSKKFLYCRIQLPLAVVSAADAQKTGAYQYFHNLLLSGPKMLFKFLFIMQVSFKIRQLFFSITFIALSLRFLKVSFGFLNSRAAVLPKCRLHVTMKLYHFTIFHCFKGGKL